MKNAILGLLFIIFCYPSIAPARNSLPREYQKNTVVMYSTQRCGYCARARQALTAANVNFVEFDVNHHRIGIIRYRELGGGGVPIFEANGRITRGYNSQAMSEFLNSYRYKKDR